MSRVLWHTVDVIKRIAPFVVSIIKAVFDDVLIICGYILTYQAITAINKTAAHFFLGITLFLIGLLLSRRK